MFLSGVCSGPTTTENVWVTGWQSQVAPSGDRRRHFRHRSLAGDRCYGSNNTGWNSTEQKAGGQGSPVMLAAGAATCSLPPTAKASEQTAALAPALRSSLHGSCAVQVRRATMLAVHRHSAYTANAQFSENSIISSLKWIILGKIANFFDLALWFSVVLMEKCRDRYGKHLTSLQVLCPEILPSGIWKFWIFV